jgi:hypothetical protein
LFITTYSSIAFCADVNGRVGLILKSGDVKYGARINVYLTTIPINVPPAPNESIYNNKYEYKKALIKSLADVFEKFEAKKDTDNYLVQQSMTDFDGRFTFKKVPRGTYYIVVTFPTTIANHKVFWQLPINVSNKDLNFELSNDNLALPPYFER